jgi:hypothetical protein
MRRTLIVTFLFAGLVPALSQISLDDVPTAVELSRGAVVPIICRDFPWPKDSVQFGTGFLFGDGVTFVTITCEHVVAEKDTLGHTLRYLPLIFAHFNGIDSSAVPIRMRIAYADERNDFAILSSWPDSANRAQMSHVFYKIITPSQSAPMDSIKEGEPILYVGYPMFLGVGTRNHPLSRLGIVAQRVKGLSYFLIDGFAQNGHSGSPVFVLRNIRGQLGRILVGITRGYPKEFSEIVQRTGFVTEPTRKAVTNPGFTVVTPMDEILRVWKK